MKTERIVDNPENHGWELVGGKWIWASGRNTGHITDGDLNGETTVWKDNQSAWVPNPRLVFNDGGYAHFTSPVKSDDRFHVAGGGGMTRTPSGGINLYTENNAGQVVLDENGNVGIGRSDPQTNLHVQSASDTQVRVNSQSSSESSVQFSNTDRAWRAGVVSGGDWKVRDVTAAQDRLTIDATGDSWFYGDVHIAEQITLQKAAGNAHSIKADTNDLIFTSVTGGKESMRLTYDGNATFSGVVGAAGSEGQTLRSGRIWLNRGSANYITAGSSTAQIVFQIGGDGIENNVLSLQSNKNAIFEGRIFKNGGTEVLSTRDLIETLSTLRASTLDETVDVRQALASACDKLIEKFEAMQDQVSTQDIQE
jgi:hypothetical protein